jgi:site-specific DNA recombinase
MGRIYDDCGNRMTPSTKLKKGLRYRYYVSCLLAQGRAAETGSVTRTRARHRSRLRDAPVPPSHRL